MQLIPRKRFPHIWREILFPENNLFCFDLLKTVLFLRKGLVYNWDGQTYILQTQDDWGTSTLPSLPWSARWVRAASSPPPRTHLVPVPLWAPGHLPSPQSSARQKNNNAVGKRKINWTETCCPLSGFSKCSEDYFWARKFSSMSKQPLKARSARRYLSSQSRPLACHRQHRNPTPTQLSHGSVEGFYTAVL